MRKNPERPTKKQRNNVFEKDIARSLLNLSVPVRLQQSKSETLEKPKPIEVAEILLTLAEKVRSNDHTTNLENNTDPTLNSDVNEYISSPAKIKSVDSEVQASTKENSTQVITDYCDHVGVGLNKI